MFGYVIFSIVIEVIVIIFFFVRGVKGFFVSLLNRLWLFGLVNFVIIDCCLFFVSERDMFLKFVFFVIFLKFLCFVLNCLF